MATSALPGEALLAQDDGVNKTESRVKSFASYYLQATLRCTRLHVLPQLLLEERPPETPKVAIYGSPWIALLHASTLLVLLGIVFALVTINAR